MKYLFFLSTLFLFSSCEIIFQDSNYLYSKDFPNQEKRVETLKKEIKFPTDFSDCEFELFNVNRFNSSSRVADIPGASSLEYKFCVEISKDDFSSWINDFSEIPKGDLDSHWIYQTTEKRHKKWETSSTPKIYKRPKEHSYIWGFQEEGIICKWIKNL